MIFVFSRIASDIFLGMFVDFPPKNLVEHEGIARASFWQILV